jgi:hypothetical protein
MDCSRYRWDHAADNRTVQILNFQTSLSQKSTQERAIFIGHFIPHCTNAPMAEPLRTIMDTEDDICIPYIDG